MNLDQRIQGIKVLLSDVDGVLTDGSITIDNEGIETKSFHVRDGLGIKLWQRTGHQFGIVTARSSHLVKLRMDELNVSLIRQGVSNKLEVGQQLMQQLGVSAESICYIGDDLSDLSLMQAVGLAATVADGVAEVRDAAHLVTKAGGGRGAMRELIETILKRQGRWQELWQTYSNS